MSSGVVQTLGCSPRREENNFYGHLAGGAADVCMERGGGGGGEGAEGSRHLADQVKERTSPRDNIK